VAVGDGEVVFVGSGVAVVVSDVGLGTGDGDRVGSVVGLGDGETVNFAQDVLP
jgi:hypothetical protein